MKIVINRCYGGFGLSHEAIMKYAGLKGIEIYPYILGLNQKEPELITNPKDHFFIYYTTRLISSKDELNENYFSPNHVDRDDEVLIRVIEELGSKANASFANLEIVEVPDDIDWEIDEYDGWERIAEKHRTWG